MRVKDTNNNELELREGEQGPLLLEFNSKLNWGIS